MVHIMMLGQETMIKLASKFPGQRREALVSLTVRYFQDHLAERSSQPAIKEAGKHEHE